MNKKHYIIQSKNLTIPIWITIILLLLNGMVFLYTLYEALTKYADLVDHYMTHHYVDHSMSHHHQEESFTILSMYNQGHLTFMITWGILCLATLGLLAYLLYKSTLLTVVLDPDADEIIWTEKRFLRSAVTQTYAEPLSAIKSVHYQAHSYGQLGHFYSINLQTESEKTIQIQYPKSLVKAKKAVAEIQLLMDNKLEIDLI